MPQENVTNTFAAFASTSDKGFASPQEFEMRVEVFKENLEQLQQLNTNASEFVVRLCMVVRGNYCMSAMFFICLTGMLCRLA